MNIDTIQEMVKDPQTPPRTLSDAKRWLAAESSTLMEEELNLQFKEADFFNLHRPNMGSDKSTESAWKGSEEGRRLLTIKNTQGRIKKLMGSISSALQVFNNEIKNNY